jgi:hypothetical protein
MNMPGLAMVHAIIAPSAPVVRPNEAGNTKMPEPIVGRMTGTVSADRESF